jgi:hypothetical protein
MSRKTGSYVGPDEVHGAAIVRVERDGSALFVHLLGDEGRGIVLQFVGVTEAVCSRDVAGHRIHALMEADALGPRRFVFVPLEEGQAPKLEVIAEGFGELDPDGFDGSDNR